MSVNVKRTPSGSWEVDLHVVLPNGFRHRDRRRLRVSTKSAAVRWGRAREVTLLTEGLPAGKNTMQKEVPTLAEFGPRFLDGYARANQHKPSGIAAKETVLRVHLTPLLGGKKLDAITNEDVQRLKTALRTKAPKTVNNVLTVLNTLLKTAVEWNLIVGVPCTIKMLKVPKSSAVFHDFETYERLLTAARAVDPQTHLIVLLGGEAGLRLGEVLALRWEDVDLATPQLYVQRSDWCGQVTAAKGSRVRYIGLTNRLAEALRTHRHLRSPLVLCDEDGQPLLRRTVQNWVRRAACRGKVQNSGVHVLRHTFCSRLAMKGAPTMAIQELAGHANITTTQRYMHLSPAAKESAIRLLDEPIPDQIGGEDTTSCGVRNANVLISR